MENNNVKKNQVPQNKQPQKNNQNALNPLRDNRKSSVERGNENQQYYNADLGHDYQTMPTKMGMFDNYNFDPNKARRTSGEFYSGLANHLGKDFVKPLISDLGAPDIKRETNKKLNDLYGVKDDPKKDFDVDNSSDPSDLIDDNLNPLESDAMGISGRTTGRVWNNYLKRQYKRQAKELMKKYKTTKVQKNPNETITEYWRQKPGTNSYENIGTRTSSIENGSGNFVRTPQQIDGIKISPTTKTSRGISNVQRQNNEISNRIRNDNVVAAQRQAAKKRTKNENVDFMYGGVPGENVTPEKENETITTLNNMIKSFGLNGTKDVIPSNFGNDYPGLYTLPSSLSGEQKGKMLEYVRNNGYPRAMIDGDLLYLYYGATPHSERNTPQAFINELFGLD